MNMAISDLKKKKILITGAGGSIGSGLVDTLYRHEFRNLILLDYSEYLLFHIVHKYNYQFDYYLADIRDEERISEIFEYHKPDIVFHAAALKHVPLLENNVYEAVKTNIAGTLNLVKISNLYKIEKFIFISSDKAVKPTSIMGATKRIGEQICQFYQKQSSTQFSSVRFGNVLNSSGSVIPIFKEQIEKGGPVTITDKEMRRFFMSLDQACSLLIKILEIQTTGGEVFFLDMGEPIKIYDLAKYIILSYGKMPEIDIPIVFTGLRPGEKLTEEVYNDDELLKPTNIPNIKKVILNGISENFIELVYSLIQERKPYRIKQMITLLVPEYKLEHTDKIF